MAGTSAAAAMADTSKLSKFDGKSVVRTSIAVTNAGDGLSEALSIDPMELHHGERGYLLIEWEVTKITHSPISKDTPDLLDRKHTLRAGTATIVSADLAEDHIKEQAAKIAAAKRHATGEYSLDDEAMIVEHGDGQHADLRDGCPLCDDERAAAAAEANAEPDPPGDDGKAPPEPTSIADAAKARKGRSAAAKKAPAK